MTILIETIEGPAGTYAKIYVDPYPENPRESCNNLATLWINHSRYNLGDEDAEIEDYDSLAVVVPLYLYDHSGIAVSTRIEPGWYHAAWDSSRVGFAYVTRQAMFEAFGWKNVTEKRRKALLNEVIQGELRTYNAYLNTDTYFILTFDADGDQIDNTGTYYGLEDARTRANDQLQFND